jgi:phosphatidylserine/phosphatidylglycerophosphate/cardiolipin synthase-like enzyme
VPGRLHRRAEAGPLEPAFTPAERALVLRLSTPRAVQRWLRSLPYNWEKRGETLRSFRSVLRRRSAHCLEAALAAACILERHGYPPLLLSFESQDGLDHVLFLFGEGGRWGAVARSRDPGLHGRKPVFRSPRQLAASYRDAYVDLSGRVTGYAVADLRDLGRYDWRLSQRNVWRVEKWLVDYPHRPLPMSEVRYRRALARYERFRARFPDPAVRPGYFDGRETWL